MKSKSWDSQDYAEQFFSLMIEVDGLGMPYEDQRLYHNRWTTCVTSSNKDEILSQLQEWLRTTLSSKSTR